MKSRLFTPKNILTATKTVAIGTGLVTVGALTLGAAGATALYCGNQGAEFATDKIIELKRNFQKPRG